MEKYRYIFCDNCILMKAKSNYTLMTFSNRLTIVKKLILITFYF